MAWKCMGCGRVFDNLPERVTCTYCSKRIFTKTRPEAVVKKVKAI
ncbi:MAG: DNA-directed RNA polymerase subunit P [Candidatus Hadarchaeota archaeon]